MSSGVSASEVVTHHVPIMVEPIVSALMEPFLRLPEDADPHWLVDCTLGGGGHTAAFLLAFAENPKLRKHKILSVDQDAEAIQRAQLRFEREIREGRLELAHCRFSEIAPLLEGRPILGLMADLGFSSDQLEDRARGLSFQGEGPLDMRLDPSRGESCREYLSRVTEAELEEVLREYGEERFSRKIASVLVNQRRKEGAPKTTTELADLVVSAVPSAARHGRIHAATRTFQALRILVNEELEELDKLLGRVILSVQAGGRVAILSFHSLEDRRVKRAFKNREESEAEEVTSLKFRSLTKKPIEATEDEIRRNPRSRSAKLRIAERVEGTEKRNKYR